MVLLADEIMAVPGQFYKYRDSASEVVSITVRSDKAIRSPLHRSRSRLKVVDNTTCIKRRIAAIALRTPLLIRGEARLTTTAVP